MMIMADLPPYSIVYEIDEIEEMEGTDNADNQQLITAIEQLNQTISELNKNLTPEEDPEEAVEEDTEEITEEVVEIPEEELPVQKKDLQELQKSVDQLNGTLSEINSKEETYLGYTKEYVQKNLDNNLENLSLTFLDETVDHHLYLTSEVENASINDVFTLSLSIRNLLLVFFLFWLALKIFGLLRAAIERVMNR